jgi:hypothetical protein
MFEIAEDSHLAYRGEVLPCRVSALSAVSVLLTTLDDRDMAEAPTHLHLDRLGWIEISIKSRSGRSLRAQLQPTFEQRAHLVVRLFSVSHGNVTDTANLRSALAGLARRSFRGR